MTDDSPVGIGEKLFAKTEPATQLLWRRCRRSRPGQPGERTFHLSEIRILTDHEKINAGALGEYQFEIPGLRESDQHITHDADAAGAVLQLTGPRLPVGRRRCKIMMCDECASG